MQYNLQIHDIIAYIMPALQMLWKLVCVSALIVCINFVVVQFIVHVFDTVIANIICNYITMPGVVHHELSHAVAAFIFGAKIKKIRILPNKDSLGEVFIQPRGPKVLQALQLSMSAIAPMVFGSATLYCMFAWMLPYILSVPGKIIFYYFAISIFIHMTMSLTDIKRLLEGIIPTGLIVLIIMIIAVHA